MQLPDQEFKQAQKLIQGMSVDQLQRIRALVDFSIAHGKPQGTSTQTANTTSYEKSQTQVEKLSRVAIQTYSLLESCFLDLGIKAVDFGTLSRVGCSNAYSDAVRSIHHSFSAVILRQDESNPSVSIKMHGPDLRRFIKVVSKIAKARLLKAGVRPTLKPMLQQLGNCQSLLDEGFPGYSGQALSLFVMQDHGGRYP